MLHKFNNKMLLKTSYSTILIKLDNEFCFLFFFIFFILINLIFD